MGLTDRISDVIGGALGALGNVAVDSFEKAGQTVAQNRDAEKPAPGLPAPATDDPKSLMYDPFAVIDQLGYKDRPTGITYSTLAEMARRVPIYAGIVQTRVNQVANFALPQEHKREPGFQVVMREEEDKATTADRKRAREIERWLLNTGSTHMIGKDSLETFFRKFVRDSMIYDQGCFEVVDNRKGEPSDFYAVDGATIRIADVPLGAELDDNPERVRYVQVYDETVIAEFAAHELAFCIRNPRTGIRLNGYGFSELEMLIGTITAMLWGFEYNKRFFSQGSTTKGIINFKGSIPDSKMDAFRRHWYQLISGVANAWRTPVTNAEELQYINLHSSNRDMEYASWMDFLIKLTCGVCQFDPAEIGFVYGNTGQSHSMFQAPSENLIKQSKDRGLRPILRSLAQWMNTYLIWRIDDNFKVKFTGMDPRNADQIIDGEKKQVTYLKTVDEVRAENDLEPLPDGKGEIILDPTWLQSAQAKDMAGDMGGEEGGEEGFSGELPDAEEGSEGEASESETGNPEWDAMLSQLGQVGPEEAEETEKSLARVRRQRRGGIVTYDVEL